MEEVKLIGAWPSPFMYRVIWALKLKGVKYEYVQEDLSNKSDLLLQYNPVHKKIPILVHRGKPICESVVILEYIEETWPHNPLLPKDPHERAIARFWTKFGEDKIIAFFGLIRGVGEEQEKAVKDSLEVLRILEEHGFGKKKFFGGDTIGLADIGLGWISHWMGMIEEAVGIKLVEADRFPHLHEWIKNFKEVPIIKNNLPDRDEALAYIKRRREMILASSAP